MGKIRGAHTSPGIYFKIDDQQYNVQSRNNRSSLLKSSSSSGGGGGGVTPSPSKSYSITINGLSDDVRVTVNGVPYSPETKYKYGSSITIFAEIIDKPQYHFENTGDTWEIVMTITENNTVTLPEIVKDTYTITFENWDGTPLQTSEVEYGEMPVYRGETPTRPSDAQYIYTFSGWAPEIVAVTCNKTYTATYSHKEAPALTYWGEVNTEDLDALGTSFRLGDLQLILSGTSDPAGIEGEELVIGGTGKTKEYVYNVTEDDKKAYNLWNDEEITDEEYNEYLTGHSKYFIYVVPNEYSDVTITEASQTSILVPYSIEKDYTIDDVEYAIIKIEHQPDTKFQIDNTYWSCRELINIGDQTPVIKKLIIKINS